MRKNKTWEITLTDNARLVANEPIENSIVYTTDTEAYLNFRVIDSGFEFNSATIAMLNKDDGSIVERSMTKEDDTAVYEIESDIIPHFGLWQAQVLFKQDEEIFTSTPVTFVIERYMMSEQPPKLEDVTNWKDLYENATETINELNQINDDLNATNQIVEEAEAQRASAESSRASAEEQREIDHANRSAELADKADKTYLIELLTELSLKLSSTYAGVEWDKTSEPSMNRVNTVTELLAKMDNVTE